MKHLTFLNHIFVLVLSIIAISASQYHVVNGQNVTCTLASGCGTRAYLSDLSGELDKLRGTRTKIMSAISLLNSTGNANLTSVISLRVKQAQKLQVAIDNLALEVDIISSKCQRYNGDDCSQGCATGWGGSNCAQMACFGVVSTSASVCSGRGNCTSANKCICKSPYIGDNCESVDGTSTTYNSVTGFKYSDGTYARSCKEYRYPTAPRIYLGEGSGLYQIKPGNTVYTVFCDMETDNGGWTMFAGIKSDYYGVHYHVFDDNNATSTNDTISFHIPTTDLMNISTQIRASTDSYYLGTVSNFFTVSWPFSAYCTIPQGLRDYVQRSRSVASYSDPLMKAYYPSIAATCYGLKNVAVVPTHVTYSKAQQDGHCVGFRMGISSSQESFMSMGPGTVFATYSYAGAPEGSPGTNPGVYYVYDSVNSPAATQGRTGALFFR